MGKNRGHGTPRGGYRGGRGGNRGGRGGGRGVPFQPPTSGGGGGYHSLAEMGEVQLISEDRSYQAHSGTSTPRGRGSKGGYNGQGTPGRGGFKGRGRGPFDDYLSPSKRGHGGIGDRSPRGRGRGGGGGWRGGKSRSDAPLSELLHQERPLLKPVIFVRSTMTATLFEEEEEIFKPGVEEIGEDEQSHVPTADRVFRLFSGGNIPPMSDSEDDVDEVQEQLEEIDFNDIGKLMEPTTSTSEATMTTEDVEIMEEQFTGIYIDRGPNTQVIQQESVTISDTCSSTVVTSSSTTEATTLAPPPPPIVAEAVQTATHAEDQQMEVDSESHHPDPAHAAAPPSSSTPPPPAPPAPPPPARSHTPSSPQLGFYIDTTPTQIPDLPPPPVVSSDDEEIVYVAPHPRSGRDTPAVQPSPASVPRVELPTTSIITGMTRTTTIVEETTDTPVTIPAPPPFSSVSFSFPAPAPPSASASASASATPSTFKSRQIPIFTAGSRTKAAIKQRKRDARAARRRAEREGIREGIQGRFGFGIGYGGGGGGGGKMVEEMRLREEREEMFLGGGGGRGRDPKWEERRRGDSDVDWGSDDDLLGQGHGQGSGEGLGEGLEGGAEGMLVDEDIDLNAMKAFVRGMSRDGGGFVTMDDIEDGERMRREDEDEEQGGVGSSEEEEEDENDEQEEEDQEDESEDEDEEEEADAIVNAEEELMISEEAIFGGLISSDDDDDEDELDEEGSDDDDIDASPGASFQARLEKLREQSRKAPKTPSKGGWKGKGKAKMEVDSDEDEDEEDGFLENLSWAEQDEEFIAHIQDLISENEAVLTGRDRKARNKLFNAIRDGAFDDMDDFQPARKKKDKYKDLPSSLQDQWQKDREKKAEHKRLRDLAKLEAASDPLAKKKGGKKGRKAMLAASRLDPTIHVLPNRIIDMTTLVQQIRRFIADLDGPQSMSLPPTNKETRKAVHEMAIAFNLKSKSDGKGEGRYTTLRKTSRSHLPADERKIARIVRRFGGRGGGEFVGGGEGKRGGERVPKHKEGEEVGKHAPKIGESNTGFQLLARMGWSEGDRIGVTGGLDAPITALFKVSKLGLGATR